MASRSLKRTLLSALLFPLWSTVASAQDSFSFIPSSASSTFPECGLTCTILQTAQSACVPPSAAVTNDQTYISCFCQSSYLTSLKSSGALCTTCTSASDQQLLVNWYNGYCDGGYTSTLSATTTTTTASSTSSTATGATTTTAAAKSSTASSSSKSSSPPGWASTHKRWIIMLVVLAVGFGALAALGTWYKKRHDARQPGLYHGNDSSKSNVPGSHTGPTAGAAFFTGSLRNMSKSNVNSTIGPSTANNSSNNVAAKTPRAQAGPSMSMTSLSNTRSSLVNQNTNIIPTSTNNNNNNNNNNNMNNNNQWGPHQGNVHTRDFDDITPVDGTAFRNAMAAAAAAAALDKGGATASTANASRTDISSVSTGGGNSSSTTGVVRSTTPRNNPNRLSKVSAQSSSTLHRQVSNPAQRGPTPQRQRSPSPVSPINDD